MTRECEHCGQSFTTASTRASYCGAACRGKAYRERGRGPASPSVVRVSVGGSSALDAVRTDLTAARVLQTPLGQLTLVLAAHIDAAGERSGAASAALVRELQATMTAVMRDQSVEADPLDELRARRAAHMRGKP